VLQFFKQFNNLLNCQFFYNAMHNRNVEQKTLEPDALAVVHSLQSEYEKVLKLLTLTIK